MAVTSGREHTAAAGIHSEWDPAMKEPRRLVRLEQAAPYASCSIATLRRRIYDGTITGHRSGKRIVLVDLNEIDRKLIRPIATAKSA